MWRARLTEGGEMGGKEGESKGGSLQLRNRVERHGRDFEIFAQVAAICLPR